MSAVIAIDDVEALPRTATQRRFDRYMAKFWEVDWSDQATRIAMTWSDPLAFALVYLYDVLAPDGVIPSLADQHWVWIDHARGFTTPLAKRAGRRVSFASARSTGKSAWWFMIIPLWALAHQHRRYIYAFSEGELVFEHLSKFKQQLEDNELLRADYPELVAPKVKRIRRVPESENAGIWRAASGVVFQARAIDAQHNGKAIKFGGMWLRMELCVGDDFEPTRNYSLAKMAERLLQFRSAIIPMNRRADIVLTGTVTMPGTIVHQLVQHALGTGPDNGGYAWIRGNTITPHHHPTLVKEPDGSERSCWPENPLFATAEMKRIREGDPVTWALNYENNPIAAEGHLWQPGDIPHGDLPAKEHVIISVDPNVAYHEGADLTGIAIIAIGRVTDDEGRLVYRYLVEDAWGFQPRSPDEQRLAVVNAIQRYNAAHAVPISLVVLEANQGGRTWEKVFHSLPAPAKLQLFHQSSANLPDAPDGLPSDKRAKYRRAMTVYPEYVRGRVLHHKKMQNEQAEQQLLGFPNVPGDDIFDAIVSGIRFQQGNVAKRSALINGTAQRGGATLTALRRG